MRDETSLIIPAVRTVLDEALAAGRRTTAGAQAIDEHQVHAERLAYAATEAAAAEALAAHARGRAGDETIGRMAAAFAAEVASRLGAEIEAHRDDFGVSGETLARTLGAPEVRAAVRAAQHEAQLREVGREVIRTRGANNAWIDGDVAEMARDSARGFARKEVAPIAERIHRHDELVPESIIRRMAELGYFGMSVPEEYGGQGMGNLVMIVITEGLSAPSRAPTRIPRPARAASRSSSSPRTPSRATSSRCASREAACCTERRTRRPATAACTPSRSASSATSCRART